MPSARPGPQLGPHRCCHSRPLPESLAHPQQTRRRPGLAAVRGQRGEAVERPVVLQQPPGLPCQPQTLAEPHRRPGRLARRLV